MTLFGCRRYVLVAQNLAVVCVWSVRGGLHDGMVILANINAILGATTLWPGNAACPLTLAALVCSCFGAYILVLRVFCDLVRAARPVHLVCPTPLAAMIV